MKQMIITSPQNFTIIDEWIVHHHSKKIMLVCDGALQHFSELTAYLNEATARLSVELVSFSDFLPNPSYNSVVMGVERFNECGCDAIIAVGGGSAIDVAKCIKLFSNLDTDSFLLNQTCIPNAVPFLAIPTTAGTGSEATRYAVIYFEGKKQSITSEDCMPDTVILDSRCLKSLPEYQRKATMMDAFCHALESFWSINSTEESRQLSRAALIKILEHMNGYLSNNPEDNAAMMEAAHIAGKAINITQTTAGHAMCYKITSMFGCAHGHAAILCDRVLYRWMMGHLSSCRDERGKEYLEEILYEMARTLGCSSLNEAADKIDQIFYALNLSIPKASEKELEVLTESVNTERLGNHPLSLDKEQIKNLYQLILKS